MTARDSAQSNPNPPPGLSEHTRDWAVLLDVDGTLLEIADTPDAVRVPDGLVGLLATVRDAFGGALALVSGRPVRELDHLFRPVRFATAGVHGAELRAAPDAGITRMGDAGGLEPARAAFRAFAVRHPGALTEDKGAAVTLHYRGAPAAADEARALGADLLRVIGPDFQLLEGKMVVEIRHREATKASAVETFGRHAPFAGRLPVYVGDDVTDEDAFEAVHRLGGHSVLVGERPGSCARAFLPSVAAVHAWLADAVPAARPGSRSP